MNRLIKKLTSYIALAALLVPMVALTMPTGAKAASSVTGGTTSKAVGMSNVTLSNVTITSEAAGDIDNSGITINLIDNTALSQVQFDTSVIPDVSASGSSLVLGVPGMAVTSITVPVTGTSAINDVVTIKGIHVKATVSGISPDYFGSAHLSVVTNGGTDPCASFSVDSQKPVISNLVSDATDGGALKIGDAIHFSFSTTEPVTIASDSYNGRQLAWLTTNGLNYTAEYVVTEGDQDGLAPQLQNVVVTDQAGNKSESADTTNVNKIIDASKPVLFMNSQNTIYPAGDVPYEWVLVFQGNTDPGRMVYLEVNSDPIKHQTLSTPNGEWRFEVAAKDLGAGSHNATISITDASGNLNSFTLSFAISEPVMRKAAYTGAGTYAAYGTSTTPREAVTPGTTSEKVKEELKDDVEDTAEGIIKAAEAQEEQGTNPWQTVVTVIAILIIAIGVGTAGYYGYEWWATRGAVAVGTSGPGEEWDKPEPIKKTVRKTVAKKKTTTKKTGRRSSSRW